jgi:hypothetical protein
MRKTILLFPVLILLAGFLFASSSPALADDDPPGRVARLNYIQGSLSFQPGGETDWTQANPNRPLTIGDNLWADRNSRGELHIGSSTIRIGSETGITFLNLDDRTVQIQLAQGSLNVHVRRLEGGDAFEIDTPNLAFTLERAGDYRVDVDPNGNATSITVRQGEGEATGGGSEYHMDTGDQANFSGTDSLTYDGGQAGRFDEFDNWCHSRDDREERSESARYVSRDVIGYDDLDENGEWRDVPDYGHVWFPTHVVAGWAPYRYGHWVWVAPWGWTWVEDEPWGFAPFHYGRWAEVGGGWCWVPGPVVVRPVYAPALVVFVGGPRFGASVAFGGGGGGVAWFPLGPREVYVPPYRTSERYVQKVNVTNTTVNVVNVTNVYNNVTVNNTTVNKVTYMHQNNVQAVTAVSHDTFVNARPVAASTVRIDSRQIQTAEIQRNFTVAPVQRSVVGASAVATAKPPAAVMQRQVVAKETPPPPHATFNGGQQQLRTFRQASSPAQQQPQQQQRSVQQQQQAQPQIQQRSQQQQQNQQRTLQPPTQPGQQQPQIQQRSQQQVPPEQQQQIQQQTRSVQQPPQQPVQRPPQPQVQERSMQQQQQNQQRTLQPPTQPGQQQPQIQQRSQQQVPPEQQQQIQQQTRSVQQPPQQPVQQPPQPQVQQRSQQQQVQQQQSRQQGDQTRRPPEQSNPAVKFAPPARATEDTYHPHQFERPQAERPQTPPPQAAPPPRQEREQPKPQERGQESKQPENQKERK